MQMTPVAEFSLPRKQVSLRLGLPLAALPKWSGPEGQWWRKVNNRIFFSEAGVLAMQNALAASVESVAAPQVVKDEHDQFTVVRIRNTRVLHVIRNGDQYDPRHPIIVWLPRPLGHLFSRGMKVRAIPRNGREGLWDYQGGERGGRQVRYPRARGKW